MGKRSFLLGILLHTSTAGILSHSDIFCKQLFPLLFVLFPAQINHRIKRKDTLWQAA